MLWTHKTFMHTIAPSEATHLTSGPISYYKWQSELYEAQKIIMWTTNIQYHVNCYYTITSGLLLYYWILTKCSEIY